ncbi:hypothetical protein [Actinoplanes xinjiangensis]|uniref:Transmembrane transport protein n=1 Tax=Actinoplanes xinjiangensis TaxID=512350 RepID=A0A316F3X4_9ACTN|nr:hypothetical protein [Actinoplanes xinjiangensis]PWK40149.1 hypothetical protein BC793_12088 [Actinoplanes xinjiangensis]GIF42464.1 hypothetical protein Axi01nite_67750 [Actinoplanes xinjiangensis]
MTEEPGYRPEQLIRPVSRGLLAAGIAGFTGSALIATLWATEPASLPTRTRWAFAGLIVVGLAWAALAAWTLWRRPLFAVDRVIAGRLAVVFTTATTLVTVVVAGPLAAGPGLLMIAVAVVVLVRARACRDRLRSQIAALEGHGGQ